MPPCRDKPAVKKALLIGIRYETDEELSPIPTSISNVRKIAGLLEKRYEYTDIVIMTDEDEVEERYQPTKTNLEREIAAFCCGAAPGDRRFFYYAGHSGQLRCKTGSEEDGLDETVVTVDGVDIRDNILHKLLVKPLPKGSALTAIFDSCNSGTLLDLAHYKCNNVYRPWVNKGKRRSKTLQNRVVRQNGQDNGSAPPSRPRSTFRKGSGEAEPPFRSLIQTVADMYPTTTSEPAQVAEESDKHRGERCASPERDEHEQERCASPQRTKHDGERRGSTECDEHDEGRCAPTGRDEHDGKQSAPPETAYGGGRCASPEPLFVCDGWCREKMPGMTTLDHPDVISISSSNDGQTSYDASTRNGGSISMTTFLVKILETKPQITYSELMTLLNHEVHTFTRGMHLSVKEQRRARRGKSADPEGAEPEGEMNNFQEPQLGSLSPVDMDRLFVL